MLRWGHGLVGLILTLPLAGGDVAPASGQIKEATAKDARKPAALAKQAAAKGPTCKVERSPFKIEVSLKGIFEAAQMSEVVLAPKAWAPPNPSFPLTVVKAVEHGAVVKKGDVLVQLDLEKIDQAIKDLREEHALTDVAIRQAEKELPILEKSTPVELTAAERARKIADEDLQRFLKVDRALAEEASRRYVESAEYWLTAAQEELKQLQKMYRDKDLTEETEEYILKRQKQQVRMAEFELHSTRILSEQSLKIFIPRQEVNLRENATKQTIALEKAVTTLPLTLDQKRLALAKQRYDFAKSTERLDNLEKDREAMTIRSPADGIVYYGKATRGQWTTASSVASKMQRGGVIMPEEVFMTVVSARPVFVRGVVEEKDLHQLQPGIKGRVVITGFPDLKMAGHVTEISPIPLSAGNFEAHVAVDPGEDAKAIMPGMACTVKITPYRKDDALVVPATAVFSDDDGDSHYVWAASKGSAPEQRPVQVGKTSEGKTEIVGGVKEGDEILASKPQAK